MYVPRYNFVSDMHFCRDTCLHKQINYSLSAYTNESIDLKYLVWLNA